MVTTTRQQDATSIKVLESAVLVKSAESANKRTKSLGKDSPAPKRRRVNGEDVTNTEDTFPLGASPVEEQTSIKISKHGTASEAGEEQSGEAQLGHKMGGSRSKRKERRERISKSGSPRNQTSADLDANTAGGAITEVPITSNSNSQPVHVRFDSEEPAMVDMGSTDMAPALSSEEEMTDQAEDSDDEAPEDVSASAAQKNTEAAAAGVAKAVQQQRLTEKRKRQERAARLKEQVQSSTRTKKDKFKFEEAATKETTTSPNDVSDDEELPELLPEEVLAEDFTRHPTPPPVERKQKNALLMQRKAIPLDAGPPMDIKVGPVNVRVLEKFNRLLPPKASSSGRSLREAWLLGRRGKGGLGVERKRIGGGFVKH